MPVKPVKRMRTYQNPVDMMFQELEAEETRSHFAVRQYKKYKLAAGKTAKIYSDYRCGARLGTI